MTVFAWPSDILPSTFQPTLIGNTQSGGRSPFDGTEQTLEQPGARWGFDLAFEGLPAEEHRRLLAFLASLRGRAGRFTWSPPLPRQGTAGGAPVMRLAGQTGTKVHTQGWTASAPLCVALGDFLSWDDGTGRPALHMVTGNATAEPSNSGATPEGLCDFHVSPPLRRSPALLAPLTVSGAIGVFRLVDDRAGLNFGRGLIAGGNLQIEEALW